MGHTLSASSLIAYTLLHHVYRNGLILDLLASRHAAEARSMFIAANVRNGLVQTEQKLLVISRERSSALDLNANPGALPFEDGTAGAMIFGAELWLSSDQGATLREANRLLHPNGVFLVVGKPARSDAEKQSASWSSSEGTWWLPSSEQMDELLRRHFPHLSIFTIEPTKGALATRRPALTPTTLELLTQRSTTNEQPHQRLYVASKRPKRLPTSIGALSTSMSPLRMSPHIEPWDRNPSALRDRLWPDCELTTFLREAPEKEAPDAIIDRPATVELLPEPSPAPHDPSESTLESLRQRLLRCEREVIALRESGASLRTRAEEAEAELERKEPTLAQLRGRAIQAEAELQRASQGLDREKRAKKKLVEELESANQLLLAANDAREQADTLRLRAEAREKQEARQREELELRLLDLSQSLAKTRAELAEKTAEVATTRHRIDDYIEELAAAAEQKRRLTEEHQLLRKARDEARQELGKLRLSQEEDHARAQEQVPPPERCRLQGLIEIEHFLERQSALRLLIIRLLNAGVELSRWREN